MDKAFWEEIVKFEFDTNETGEYDFATRLAKENYWTKNFTYKAIIEYKKFMYLAAKNHVMVSPSEVVDIVWHQHLIFTRSYTKFCTLLKKKIQHIPSTHNKKEFKKFQEAKQKTQKLYKESFGNQPKEIWENNTMFDSLNLEKSSIKLRTFIIIGILFFAVASLPLLEILRPVYLAIKNPLFLWSYALILVVVFGVLELINRYELKRIVNQFEDSSFVFNLQPLEMVYLKTQKLENVVHGVVNNLIEDDSITVFTDYKIEHKNNRKKYTIEESQVTDTIKGLGKIHYSKLLNVLIDKPVFQVYQNCIDALKKYILKSKKFANLFYVNFIVLFLVFEYGLLRLVTGYLRGKPIQLIGFLVLLVAIAVGNYLYRLSKLTLTKIISEKYKNEIIPLKDVDSDWNWSYYLQGFLVVSTIFRPLVRYSNKNSNSSFNDSCGTSCGFSCSSCSSCSSCGGCGD